MQVKFELEGLGADKENIEVFTTAHDTIYGVTFMVFAPEHPLIEKYYSKASNHKQIKEYIDKAVRKSDIDREVEKQKTGVEIKGLYAVNPINGKKIPVWVADYVLMGYGTGAVMAVPGEDERDYEFAQKFNLPIVFTTDRQEFVNYQTELKQNRKKYKMANSDEFNGLDFESGRINIQRKLESLGAGKALVNYKMRDWSVSRQRYWGAPIPIIHCEKDGIVLVEDEQLPVVLPELDDFKPSGDGRSALARAKDWLEVECPKCGGQAERETDTLDTYICSSWYMYRYFDPHNQQQIFDSEIVKKWEPVDFYNGADHATAHLLYARFIVHFFKKLGLVTSSDGAMFSKSKGNAPDPLDIVKQGYGADALRTYLMFAAPLEIWTKWDPQGVPGTHRFLSRLWNLSQEYKESKAIEIDKKSEIEIRRLVHSMIKKVTEDLESSRYNTAIAAAMGCVSQLYKIKTKHLAQNEAWKEAIESLVMCVAPFAPHIADELWFDLGHSDSVNKDHWPNYDEKYLSTDMINIVVQVNGKLRANIQVPADASEEDILETAKSEEKVAQKTSQLRSIEIFYRSRLLAIGLVPSSTAAETGLLAFFMQAICSCITLAGIWRAPPSLTCTRLTLLPTRAATQSSVAFSFSDAAFPKMLPPLFHARTAAPNNAAVFPGIKSLFLKLAPLP
jgi:leucyl-tRNA synthetase